MSRLTEDDRRANFLIALNNAEDIKLNDFEAGLLDNCLGQIGYSRKQAECIDRMRAKYEERLKNFNPDKGKSLATRAAEAEADWNRDMSRMTVAPLKAKGELPKTDEHWYHLQFGEVRIVKPINEIVSKCEILATPGKVETLMNVKMRKVK